MEAIQTYNQPKSCDRTNMQLNFLANFPRAKQAKLMERWFSASERLSKMDSAKAIEEKLIAAEQRRLARFEGKESTETRVIRAQMNAIDARCATGDSSKVDTKIRQVQTKKDELLAAKLEKLAQHHAKVGKANVQARKEAAEIDRKYAQLQKENAAAERVAKIQAEKKAKAAAMSARRASLKKAVEDKIDTAEESLNASEFQLVESFLGKSISMPRMSIIEENIEPEVKGQQEDAPKTQSLDRSFYKKAFSGNQMPELKNIAITATASNKADAEMSFDVEQKPTEVHTETSTDQKIVTINGQKMLMTTQTTVSFQPI